MFYHCVQNIIKVSILDHNYFHYYGIEFFDMPTKFPINSHQ